MKKKYIKVACIKYPIRMVQFGKTYKGQERNLYIMDSDRNILLREFVSLEDELTEEFLELIVHALNALHLKESERTE